ncbi:WD40 repeat-like protein [Tilletiaria anomala UBC 951]|uniref:Pre-mRNA-splicing factor PRP46 n=1 Tax=Tilletiaria anomala (strain ATCC 24038 / CBS 436.72 / UBC 951) TaxID=1037660 RepID=A0A066VJP6_TILAU|nr:WD40 repeat-like protein [Tilletiaria anomala UBC 951]KDN40533.1 WD40 repeat-like protein [Tilletiaria anomala UBC 951]
MATSTQAPPAQNGHSGLSATEDPLPPLEGLARLASKRARAIFSEPNPADVYSESRKARLASKVADEYAHAKELPAAVQAQQGAVGPALPGGSKKRKGTDGSATAEGQLLQELDSASPSSSQPGPSDRVVAIRRAEGFASANGGGTTLSTALIRKKEAASRIEKPQYHPQWKLMRVISGHLGWVRSLTVEPGNKWFATGAGDRMIKIWDLASGELKLSLTGHISTVRGLAVSNRHPYLFSAGEDKVVKCWDLETNKVIRNYIGHQSGIYSLALHPTLDVVVTAGRDSVARVWDMRTRAQIHVLGGHSGTVASVVCQEADPQVITGSMDQTIRLWDLAAGKSLTTLTHHKKSVRALALHPTEFSFASGSAAGRNVKTWKCPEGTLLNNMTQDGIVNTLSVNADGVLFSGGDNGSLRFFDYSTGVPFQSADDIPQPGSLDAEAGVFCSAFDQSGTRLLTGGADKTIKVYREAL